MKKLALIAFLLVTCYSLLVTAIYADIPRTINYQGKLTDKQGYALDGSYNITFKLYDAATGGNLLWQEAHSGVSVSKGLFSVLLGTITPLNLAFDKPYYLGIKVGADPEMTPRQALASTPYAFTSISVPSGQIVYGYELKYINATTVIVNPGLLYNGETKVLKTQPTTLDITNANGYIGGASLRASSTWLYVYVDPEGNIKMHTSYPNKTDTQGNVSDIKYYYLSGTTYYRCIGAVRLDTSQNIMKFFQSGNTIIWDVPVSITTAASPGAWSSATSCSVGIPAISTHGIFGILAQHSGGSSSAHGRIWIRQNGSTWATDYENGIVDGVNNATEAYATGQRMCFTDSSQQIQYYTNNSGGGSDTFAIDVEGYILSIR